MIRAMRRRLQDALRSGAIAYLSLWARLVLWRRKPSIVGITGSVGKTTTTDMVAAVLSHPDAARQVGGVWKTRDNMNDSIMLPLVVLGFDRWPSMGLLLALPFRAVALATFRPYPRILVLEYGIGREGEMKRRSRLAQPAVAVVTAIGPAHLERYRTLDGIAREKGDLLEGVPPSGLVVLGADSPHASALENRTRAPVVKVAGRGRDLSGEIARVVAGFYGVGRETASAALEGFTGSGGRLNVLELGRITVTDDAFNANPLSMQLGLDTLAGQTPPGRRRVAILGHMGELGDEAPRYHEEIGSYARDRADLVVGVGDDLARGYQPDLWFRSSRDCADHLHEFVRSGDCLLVKGSHSAHCDAVVTALKQLAVDGGISDAGPGTEVQAGAP